MRSGSGALSTRGTNLVAIAPTYCIHTDVMSDVVLENTLEIKCIF